MDLPSGYILGKRSLLMQEQRATICGFGAEPFDSQRKGPLQGAIGGL
jgi:hypothetical protein